MATQLQEPPQVPDAVIAAGADEAQTEGTDTRDFEAEARAQGWRPRDEFPGDPNKWTDAETFVRRGEEVLPFIKKENASLKQKISQLERDLKRVLRSEAAAHENAVAELKAQQREAVATGDVEAFEALDRKADTLRKNMQEDSPTQGEDPAEQVLAFRENNAWYDKGALASASELEVEARLFADRTADRWIAQGKPQTMKPSEFYAELEREVNERFPMLKHKAARPKPASDVAGVTNRAAPKGAKGYDQLPAEAKRQCDRFVANGTIKSREDYVKRYQWDS